jgi:hypothetical protein
MESAGTDLDCATRDLTLTMMRNLFVINKLGLPKTSFIDEWRLCLMITQRTSREIFSCFRVFVPYKQQI